MRVVTLKEVDSTNLYAKNNLHVLEDRTIVHALSQTSGRGRLTRKWIDFGQGNLFVSFVLKPSSNFDEKYSNLTQYLSVVLAKVLENYGLDPKIKWPNDVLINGKKIAGILSETVMQGSNFKGLVLGIGVNLNATTEKVKLVEDKPVTALNLEIGEIISSDKFLNELADEFFENYDEFLQKGFEFIKSDYISRTSFLDTEVCVQGFNDTKKGIAKGITDSGELILEDDDKQFVLTIGDILC